MAKNSGQELSLYKVPLLLNLLSEVTKDTLQKVMFYSDYRLQSMSEC